VSGWGIIPAAANSELGLIPALSAQTTKAPPAAIILYTFLWGLPRGVGPC
jgi:hypothetical protein